MTTPRSRAHLTTRERLIAVLDVLEFRRQQRRGHITMLLSNGRRPRILTDIVADAAQRWGVSPKSVWRWLGLYDRGAFDALARRTRSDSYFARRPDAAELAARLLEKKRSAQEIHETLRLAVPAPAPCYPTVASYCRRLRAERRAARRCGKQHGAVA
ncbi:MAG: hypothetical protein ABSH05_28005 [Bryobacteraceae bacterium]|jgi:hypothetical protein